MYRKTKQSAVKAEWLRTCKGVSAVLVAGLMLSRATDAMTVRLGDMDASSMVVIHVGDRIRLELHTAPAAGFVWRAKKLDASHLEELGKGVRPDSGRLDAAGTQVFVWKAISPGDASVGLEYSRPNDEKTLPPAKRVELKVQVVAGELTPAPPGNSESLAPVLQPLGRYEGALACSDCLGIQEQLMLFAQNAKEVTAGVFVDVRRYLGAADGEKTIAETGKFAVVHGTYADPSMTLYVLGAPAGGIENYRLEPDRLVPLDPQGLPVPHMAGHEAALYRVEMDNYY